MQGSDIPDTEIAKFVDHVHWFKYFPKEAEQDLRSLGLGIDWRRKFVTTDINPFYDSFVRWQFHHLEQKKKIKFGERYCIYSPKDKQPCMDHDRSTGEGVGPQEYTIFKVKILGDLSNLALAPGKPVYLLAATLKSETIGDETNILLKPDMEYVVLDLMNEELGICSKRAALNISYQRLTPKFGEPEIIATIKGQALLNQPLEVFNRAIQSFPSTTIKEDQGTGFILQKGQATEQLIRNSDMILYKEPEKQVISRTGNECVVALCDQWFLDYGNEDWKNQVRHALNRLKTYPASSRRNFNETIDWLHEHACSRTYGLGTKLPWDEKWHIESLSDSTIYMAYYTVVHLLQGGHLIGDDSTSPIGIKPEQMSIAVWDYIFFGHKDAFHKALHEDKPIPEENLQKLRREFSFWYPMDFRSSGKDLIPNHLTYCIYNHCAIWEEEADRWPLSFRANGHLLLNGQKMSKSTGNFLTLENAIKLYGADAVRYALADSGDGIDDANFVDKQAETGLLKLYNFLKWCEDSLRSLSELREGSIDDNFGDRVFDNAMNKLIEETKIQYDEMMFKEALRCGFFEYQELWTKYKEICGSSGVHRALTRRFIETQAILLSPICPHISQKIWQLLGNAGSIALTKWPQVEVDESLYESYMYLNEAVHEFRIRLRAFQAPPKPKKGQTAQLIAPKATRATIYVARTFPSWQVTVCQTLHDLYIEHNGQIPAKIGETSINKEILRRLSTHDSLKKYMKKVMPFAEMRKQMIVDKGEEALNLASPFDEREVLEKSLHYLTNTLDMLDITINDSVESEDAKIVEDCCPLKPMIVFFSD